VAPSLGSEFVMLAVVGAASVTFAAGINSSLQLAAAPEMRGRILSLYQLVYMGTTPLGALVVGALASTVGPRSGLVLGAAGALVAGAVGIWLQRRSSDPSTSGRPEAILSSGATAPARR
jgi:predicted MFS family arabinose efflux permease